MSLHNASATIFPYTTLFRSGCRQEQDQRGTARTQEPASVDCRICFVFRRELALQRHGLRADHGRNGRLVQRSEEHTSELQSPCNLVCRLLLEKKKQKTSRSR